MREVVYLSGPAGAGKSTVGEELCLLLKCPLVEVDDFKPAQARMLSEILEGFVAAGKKAGQYLAQHERVIVSEAFLDLPPQYSADYFIELVRRGLPDATDEQHFYLWCEPDEAIKRKRGRLNAAEVRRQFQRAPGPSFPGRISFDTTERAANAIAVEIAAGLRNEPNVSR